MFFYDFQKGQVSERFSTISSFTTKTDIQTDTQFLTGPCFSCHAHSFQHFVTQTWVPDDGQTRVISPPLHMSHSFLFRQSMSQGPQTLTLIAYLEYQVWQKTTCFTPRYPLTFVKVGHRGERRRRERQGRGEVGAMGQKPPAFETVKRLVEGKGLVSGAQNMCWPFEGTDRAAPALYPWQPSEEQLKSLLRSFVSPEEVIKGGKSEKTENRGWESHADTYPLSAALLKISLTANINEQCVTLWTPNTSPPIWEQSLGLLTLGLNGILRLGR